MYSANILKKQFFRADIFYIRMNWLLHYGTTGIKLEWVLMKKSSRRSFYLIIEKTHECLIPLFAVLLKLINVREMKIQGFFDNSTGITGHFNNENINRLVFSTMGHVKYCKLQTFSCLKLISIFKSLTNEKP